MPLFDQILGALNDPNQLANLGQLSSILNASQQMTGQQETNPGVMQDVMSVLSGPVRSALQEKRATGGVGQVESILNQFAGTQPNAAAVQALFTPQQQQQVAQAVAQRTGLDGNTVQSLLAIAVPLALNLLNSGQTVGGGAPAAGASNPGGNSVLGAFLDADGDGDVDLGDTLSLAGQFMSQR